MRFLHIIVSIAITLDSTLARCKRPRGNPVMGALQNILSPANADRTMQMVKMATQRSLGNAIGPCANPPIPVQYSPPILPEPCNLPVNPQIPMPNLLPNPSTLVLPNPPISSQMPSPMPLQMPTQMPVSFSSQMPLPCPSLPLPSPLSIQVPTQLPVQMPIQFPSQLQAEIQSQVQAQMQNQLQAHIQNQLQAQIQNQLSTQVPSQLACQLPSAMPLQIPSPPLQPCPCPQPLTNSAPMPEIIIERPSCISQREIVFPFPDTNCIYSPIATVPEVNIPVALTTAQDIYSCPIPSPSALFSLPAASPGSGWTQENVPSVSVGTRSQYLRKIPIPPPTL